MEQPLSSTGPTGIIFGYVTQTQKKGSVENAEVQLFSGNYAGQVLSGTAYTDPNGYFEFQAQPDGTYTTSCASFRGAPAENTVTLKGGGRQDASLDLGLNFNLVLYAYGEGETRHRVSRAIAGRSVAVAFEAPDFSHISALTWTPPHHAVVIESDRELELQFKQAGKADVKVVAVGKLPDTSLGASSSAPGGSSNNPPLAPLELQFIVSAPETQTIGGHVGVTLQRTASDPTLDQTLWVAIRNRTNAISFQKYREFLNRVLRWEEREKLPEPLERRLRDLGAHLHGVSAYQVLKTATEVFLLLHCGVRIEREHGGGEPEIDLLEERSRLGEAVTPGVLASRLREYLGHPPQLPYITRVVEAAFPEFERSRGEGQRVLIDRINEPCLLELIWSYWHEEGMLMQTINAISRRFQNVRRGDGGDPLANLEIDPLRPVNNLLWGYVQDELNRLSVARRASEYTHEYGLTLLGKALPGVHPADNRSKFLEAFHNLLYKASVFFKEDFQTTVIADGFPLLNSLKEVHLILAQGAHNQFGDLPWTARAEMMLTEFILARPEIREFLQSRIMVRYKEAWMPQVDAMNTLQGWTDVTVTHFRDLGVYGEQLLLSIRYGDWMNVNDENSAKNWARYWRPEIQSYLCAYRAVTGIDLTNPDTVDSTLPGILLQKRLAMQHRMR